MLPFDQRIFTTKGLQQIGDMYIRGSEEHLIISDKRFTTECNANRSTSVLKGQKTQMYEVTTKLGYRFRCSAGQRITVLRTIGKDIRGKDIKGYEDVALKDLRVGEALMIYEQATGLKCKSPWPRTLDQNDKNLAIVMAHILLYPQRFINQNESTGDLGLIFDTVKSGVKFNINDLNNLRYFPRVVSKYINDNNLRVMTHLHYNAYKSHLGDIVYDLGWLHAGLVANKDFDILDIYQIKHMKDFLKLPVKPFKTMLNKILGFCFVANGTINNSVRVFHESEWFLRVLQEKLLAHGVVAGLKHRSCKQVFKGKWRKDHPQAYQRMITKWAYENLIDLKDHKIWTLDIEKAHIDRFLELGYKKSHQESENRRFRYAKLINQAKGLTTRHQHWDKIATIEATKPEYGFHMNIPEGHRMCVNGVIMHD